MDKDRRDFDLCQLAPPRSRQQAESARESHAIAFRIAFAAALGLTLGEVLGWDFPFLPAMLAVQLLSGREPLSVKKGVAVIAVMAAACAFAVLVSQIFVDSPLVLLLAISLVTFLAFLLLARGPSGGCGRDVPHHHGRRSAARDRIRVGSLGLHLFLLAGSALAVLLTFAAQAFFPMRAPAEPGSAPAQQERDVVALALANAAVLMSLCSISC